MDGDPTPALTGRRRTRPTSIGCRNPWQPKPGRAPLSAAQAAVQTNRATSHLVRLQLEHAADIALNVLHALRLVEDRELAVSLDDHRRGIELHRVVMLDRDGILALVAHLGCREGLLGRAARLWGSEWILGGFGR